MTAAETPDRHFWKVSRVVPENHDTHSLYLEGHDEKFRQRRAGQFASIRLPRGDGWSEPHPFTISGAPEDEGLRFTIKNVGTFTGSIPSLVSGTPVMCAGPVGKFCRDIDRHPRIMLIAGGVGITPFLSVLRHFRNRGLQNHVILLWSNKAAVDIFSAMELKELTATLPLTVIHSLSRENDPSASGDKNYPGVLYLPGRLSREVLRTHGAGPEMTHFLCGPPPMQEFILAELPALGVDPETVERESFKWS